MERLAGGAFGVLATLANPELSSGIGAYTIIGMKAVGGAVSGAPVSTILMIFELTNDYPLIVAVMIATNVSTLITRYRFGHPYFAWQLEPCGLDVWEGHEQRILFDVKVANKMARDTVAVDQAAPIAELREKLCASDYGTLFVIDRESGLHGTITLADLAETSFDTELGFLINAQNVARLHPPILEIDQDLGFAMRPMQTLDEDHIAVVEDTISIHLVGVIHQRQVMMPYRRAILTTRGEETDTG